MTLDSDIIDGMLKRDEQAFARCYQLTSSVIYSAIFRICQNKATAQDILQETYIQAFNNLDKLKEAEKFMPWLKRIAFNKTISWIRANDKPMVDIEELTDQEGLNSETELAEHIAVKNELTKLLAVLPSQARLVLWLYAIEGYNHNEISEMHGKSVSYSKAIVSRAFKLLKTKVEIASNG